MSRTAGNVAPAGFVAGQLRDGSAIGIFDWYDNQMGQGAQITITFRVRYYNNTLFLEWQRRIKSTGALSQDWKISSREYTGNISGGTAPAGAKYQELTDSLPHIANIAQIASVLGAGVETVPGAPSNALIPFKVDADGRITVFSGGAEEEEEDETGTDTKKTPLSAAGTTTGNPAAKESWSANMLENIKLIFGFSSNYKGLGLGGLIVFIFWGVVNLVAFIFLLVARRKRNKKPKFWKAAKAVLIITVTWFAVVLVRMRVANKTT